MHNFILCKSIDSEIINHIVTDFKLSEINLIIVPTSKSQQCNKSPHALSDIKCHFKLHLADRTDFISFAFLKELIQDAPTSRKIFYLTCAFLFAIPLFLICFFIDIFNLLFWTIEKTGSFLVWLSNKAVKATPNIYYFLKLTGLIINKISIPRIQLIKGHFTVSNTLNIIKKIDCNSDEVSRVFFIDHFSIPVFTFYCLLSNKPAVIYSSVFKNKGLRFLSKALMSLLKNVLWVSSETTNSDTDKEPKPINHKKNNTITSYLRLLDSHSNAITKQAITFFTNQSEHSLTLASKSDEELKKWNLFINTLKPKFNSVHLVNLQSIDIDILTRQCNAYLLDNTEVEATKTSSLCSKLTIPTYDLNTLITGGSNEPS